MTQTASTYDKPLPAMEGLAREFYDWCKKRELRFQRCTGCGAWRHVPRELCGACGSHRDPARRVDWTADTPRGEVISSLHV